VSEHSDLQAYRTVGRRTAGDQFEKQADHGVDKREEHGPTLRRQNIRLRLIRIGINAPHTLYTAPWVRSPPGTSSQRCLSAAI
jgi:hypothetical protein